jgi:hypothetical protein
VAITEMVAIVSIAIAGIADLQLYRVANIFIIYKHDTIVS